MPKRARMATIGAGTGIVLLVLTWFAAFHVGVVEHADQSILNGFEGLHRPRVNGVASFIAHLCNPNPYVYLAAVPVLVALVRRRPRVAVALVLILLGANVTTQLLKPLLASPRLSGFSGSEPIVSPASWPSGHATAAMSLALCGVIAASQRWRPFVAALGAAFAIAVCYSFLTLGWHLPTDVLGGFLVAATWTLLGIAALSLLATRSPRGASTVTDQLAARLSLRETLGPPAAAIVAGISLVGVVALARPHGVVSYARAHEAFMLGAGAIAVLGLMLATGLALALRR
jgi:membrane-associated phospholipid phosphatase